MLLGTYSSRHHQSLQHTSHILSSLKIFVKRAWGLPDKDGGLVKKSDPYVRILAVKGSSLTDEVSRDTRSIKNDHDPDWNEYLYYGCGYWKFIEVTVWDKDSGKDDNLMPKRRYPLENAPLPTNIAGESYTLTFVHLTKMTVSPILVAMEGTAPIDRVEHITAPAHRTTQVFTASRRRFTVVADCFKNQEQKDWE